MVDIFQRYLRLRSVRALRAELAAAGIRSKRRVHPDGTEFGHQQFSQGALYLLLQNRTYRGEAKHKDNSYPGEHSAIVDKPLWDNVQAVLADNRVARATGSRTKQPSLLTGMIFDEAGERLTPTWSVKKGTRYRYYVSTSLVTGAPRGRSNCRRVPAGNLEAAVINRLRTFLANRGDLLDVIDNEADDRVGRGHLIERGRQIADELGAQAPEKTKAILMTLVRRVEIRPDYVKIDVSRSRLAALLAASSIDLPGNDRKPTDSPNQVVTLTAPVRLKRIGREMKMLVEDSNDNAAADPSLLRILARAHDIQARLVQNTKLTAHDIARAEGVTGAYIYALLRLPWLAPDITTAIVNGRQPPQLSAKKLMRLTARLPTDWAEQRTLLGFR